MIVHYINADYKDGDWSGVARFDYELHKVFPNMKTATRVRRDIKKYLNSDNIIITDNGWCLDVPNDVKCIAVHHGIAASHKIREPGWGGNVYIDTQKKMAKKKNVTFVGVSTFCTNEAKKHYNIDGHAPIINSVDTKPDFKIVKDKIILGDWRDPNKGKNVKSKLKLSDWKFKQLKCDMYNKQEGYRDASIYLNLSLCEGNSYSMLDAIACDIPVLGTDVGLYGADYNPLCGEVISWKDRDNVDLIREKLDHMYKNYDNYKPREWLLENNSFESWKTKWIELVENL